MIRKDSVRLMVGALRTMLQEAVHEGIITANPVTRLGKFYRSAKKIKEKIDPFTIEELHLIGDKCRQKFQLRGNLAALMRSIISSSRAG
jgi:hypothetical protein